MQVYLTNTKQSRVNSDTADILASSPKDVLSSVAVERPPVTVHLRLKTAESSRHGQLQLERTVSHDSVSVAADRRRLQELRLVVRCKVSARYRGAEP